MIKEYDRVRLNKDDVETGISSEDIGTVVDIGIAIQPNVPNGYCVEFFTEDEDVNMKALMKYYEEDDLILVEDGSIWAKDGFN